MAITVARVIEQIVDWTEKEIAEFEQHLGMHPNRAPAPAIDANAPAAPAASTDPDLEAKFKDAVDEIKALNDDLDAVHKERDGAIDAAKTLKSELEKATSDAVNAGNEAAELKAQLEAAELEIKRLTAGQSAATEGKTDGKAEVEGPAANQGSGTGTGA